MLFMSDLCRAIALPVDVDFMAVSSYGSATRTSGVVRIVKDLDADLAGRHVLVVEDIIDSGLTLNYLRRYLQARHPASLEICALLVKEEEQRVDLALRYLGFTMLFGLAFVVIHATEWYTLMVVDHVTPWSNPWGVPLFGGTFFGLTGLHMLHVTIGVAYLAVVAWGFGNGRFKPEDVEVSGLYWHFVDLVWMFIFPLVYLMSVNLKG